MTDSDHRDPLSRNALAHAQQLASVGYWVFYPDDGRNAWSAMARRIYGLSDEEADTEDASLFFEIVHPDDRALVNAHTWEGFDLQEPSTVEHRIVRRSDGEVRWVRSRCDVETGPDGRARLIGAVIDVTEARLAEETLRQKTVLLTEAQRIAGVGSFAWYPGDRIALSGEGARIVGIDSREVSIEETRFLELVHADDRAELVRSQALAFAQGSEFAVEFRIVRPDGTARWLRKLAQTERLPDGTPSRMLGALLDVTESREADYERRRAAALLDRAHEAAKVGTYIVDIPNRRIRVSREAALVLGVGTHAIETSLDAFRRRIVHEEDINEWASISDKAYEQPGTFSFELRARRADGSPIWVTVYTIVEADENDIPVQALGVIQDVTERRLVADALREQAALLERAHEVARLGTFIVDIPERIVTGAPESSRILGLADAPLRVTIDDFRRLFVPEEDAEMYAAAMDAAYRDGGDFFVQQRFRRSDGSIIWGVVHGEVEHDAAGRPLRALGVLQDITDQHRLQEQLQQSQKLEAIGRLAGGVAHDFNNLLTVVAGNAQLALAASRDPVVPAQLAEILRSAERATDLVRRLLAFSRSEVIELREVDLNETIGGVRRMLARLLEENIAVQTALAPTEATVYADQGQLEHVLLNLAVNARDAMPDGGRLTISTQVDGDTVTLRVSDTGNGIDEQTRALIFDPFFTTKPSGEGTGLGLSTVYGIVTSAGGTISVESEPGRGTTFTVTLPLAPGRARAPRIPAQPSIVPGAGERILIVEDEPMVRAIAAEMLSRAGYTITTANDGEDALQLFENDSTFDLIVSDLMMPGMSGAQLVAALRERGLDVPAVFTSGYPHGMQMPGLDDTTSLFVAKPFSGETLSAAVRHLLDRQAA